MTTPLYAADCPAFLMAFDDLELVGEASNGLEAVRLCENVQPDVVLMDLVMPEMDGAQATKNIRQKIPAHPGSCIDEF